MGQAARKGRRFRLLIAVAAAGLVVAGCGDSSLGGDKDDGKKLEKIRIGVIEPRSGVYKSLGDDQVNGFQLYLDLHGNKLGGHEVELKISDEGEVIGTAQPAMDKLLKQEDVLAVTGIISSAVWTQLATMAEAEKVPLIGTNAGLIPKEGNGKFSWRTSFHNPDAGRAIGKYVAEQAKTDPVYLIAADYPAGKDFVAGFKETFDPAGGKTFPGTPKWSPFPATKDFIPFLNEIKASGAKHVYCFYAGADAVNFVKQWGQVITDKSVKLYAPGYLVEGQPLLKAQGDAAKGIFNSQNYSADLDNPLNRQFVSEYQKKFTNLPTTYAMAAFDAAAVLDKAIAEATKGTLTSESLNEALGKVGQIDSPRGKFQFNSNRMPVQKWYLREVTMDGGTLTNVTRQELVTLGGGG